MMRGGIRRHGRLELLKKNRDSTGFFKILSYINIKEGYLMRRSSIFFVLILLFSANLHAQTVKVTQNNSGGWELLVDNKQFFVKGVIWSVNPPGTSHNFSLWNESDAAIRKVIDVEGELMKEAGINAIRVGGDIPRKWVEYMYNKHGIY